MSPNSLDPRSPRAYRRRAVPILAYGLSGVIVGLCGLLAPSLLGPTSVSLALSGTISSLWLLCYAIAGALITVGILLLRPEVETVGLWLMGATALVNAMTILVLRGPFTGGLTCASLLLAVWVLGSRIADLHDAANVGAK